MRRDSTPFDVEAERSLGREHVERGPVPWSSPIDVLLRAAVQMASA